jgi:arsenite-transporting ATPase
MRVLLFTGKGGVGKTTLAAAAGVRLAAEAKTVLVISTDPAHSLGDAFGVRLGAAPRQISEGLHAGHIDTRGLVDEAWSALRKHVRSVLVGAGVQAIDAEELTVLPGVEELLALDEVRRLSASGDWDVVVVDCGPTAETLRLLALPEAVAAYLGKLFPREGGAARRGVLANLPIGRLLEGWQGGGRALGALAQRLAALEAMLTDPDSTSVRLVLSPERVVIAETARTLTSLALHGIHVDELIANRLVPSSGLGIGTAARWMRARRAEQDAVLAEVRSDSDLPVRVVEHRAGEPVGQPALGELGRELYGRAGEALAPPDGAEVGAVPLLSVTGSGRGAGTEYRLRVNVPLPRSSDVDLARVGDQLVITVDGRRRLVALPVVLRGCEVADAEVDGRGAVIRFVPGTSADARTQDTVRP